MFISRNMMISCRYSTVAVFTVKYIIMLYGYVSIKVIYILI